MNTKIITLVGYGAAWLITTIFFTIRNKKTKNLAVKKLTSINNELETKTDKLKLAQILQKIPQFIIEAEEACGGGTGTVKLETVLDKIMIECLKANIEYIKEDFKYEVEKILATPQKKEESNGKTENGEQEA